MDVLGRFSHCFDRRPDINKQKGRNTLEPVLEVCTQGS